MPGQHGRKLNPVSANQLARDLAGHHSAQRRSGRAQKDMSANSCLERPPSVEYKITMTLKAIVHKAEEGGYWAEVPSLPGCLTQAETRDELKANLREAIELWLSVGDETTKSNPSDEFLELTV